MFKKMLAYAETNRETLVQDVIEKLRHFAHLYGIESLFVVGGYCRELYFDSIERVSDIDVASAFHDQAIQFAGLFASEILQTTPQYYKRSGAACVTYKSEDGEIRIEFQGKSPNFYMYNQEIRDWFHINNVDDTPLNHNLYGRDFTINTLIYSLSTEKMHDPTGQALKDLNEGQIKSLLPPELLIKYNPLAVLRAIRFAVTYDFGIDPELRHAMSNSRQNLLKSIPRDRILKEIIRILKINPKLAMSYLEKFDLDSFLLDPNLKEYLSLELRN